MGTPSRKKLPPGAEMRARDVLQHLKAMAEVDGSAMTAHQREHLGDAIESFVTAYMLEPEEPPRPCSSCGAQPEHQTRLTKRSL